MVVALVLIAIMARTLIREQESRQQVEKLAKEVESLAIYQERTRIAREIHDALGHTLTSLNIQLDVARKLFDRDIGRSKEALGFAKQLASQSLNDVRRALKMIVPSNNEDTLLDLIESLPRLAKQIEQNQSIKVSFELEPVKLSANTSHHLYCIARECLTNIQRHANANNIQISLSKTKDQIMLQIEDDGEGFAPQSVSGSFGISGMKQRAEQLGGALSIQSTPNLGTKVQVLIPLNKEHID